MVLLQGFVRGFGLVLGFWGFQVFRASGFSGLLVGVSGVDEVSKSSAGLWPMQKPKQLAIVFLRVPL